FRPRLRNGRTEPESGRTNADASLERKNIDRLSGGTWPASAGNYPFVPNRRLFSLSIGSNIRRDPVRVAHRRGCWIDVRIVASQARLVRECSIHIGCCIARGGSWICRHECLDKGFCARKVWPGRRLVHGKSGPAAAPTQTPVGS